MEKVKNKKREKIKEEILDTLRSALVDENYEVCPKLIAAAKEFGAQPVEVDHVLQEKRPVPAAV